MSLLKLRAKDAEDVQVISAVLQDAIVPVCDMAFQQPSGSFVMVAQRLKREAGNDAERICSALTVAGVAGVQTTGIDLQQRDRMLDLLAILLEPGQGYLTLVFGGDARVRLEIAAWTAALEDFGASWPALCSPCHDSRAT